MLSVTGLKHFFYIRDFTDMRCKHSRVLSIIRERLHREPSNGNVFIVMPRNRRIVRMFSFAPLCTICLKRSSYQVTYS